MPPPTPLPKTQRAIIGTSTGTLTTTTTAPIAPLTPSTILVRTSAVSVNPVDTKMVGNYCTPNAIAGCDFAGTFLRVHPDATHNITINDRVCGAIMGMNPLEPAVGAFASYVVAPAAMVMKIPSQMSFTQAAAMPTALMTAGLALFKSLGLPHDPAHPIPEGEKKPHVLVYGGSTTTGTAALQLLRESGYAPIATASPANFSLVKSCGADEVFDYRAETCGAEIKAFTGGNLKFALDCITSAESMKICYAAIGRAGGRYTALDPYPEHVAGTRRVVRADWVLGPVLLGKEIDWPEPHRREASEEMGEYGVYWAKVLQGLFDKGRLREHSVQCMEGGWEGVLEALELVRSKKVSGRKLVVGVE